MKSKIMIITLLLFKIVLNAQYYELNNSDEISCEVFIPDYFEPNPANGKIIELEAIAVNKISIKIYNNFGVTIFESEKIESKKTGLQSIERKIFKISTENPELYSKSFTNGNYYYSLNILCKNNEIIEREGEFQLIRTERK